MLLKCNCKILYTIIKEVSIVLSRLCDQVHGLLDKCVLRHQNYVLYEEYDGFGSNSLIDDFLDFGQFGFPWFVVYRLKKIKSIN